jgi:MFS family permease
MTKSASIWKDKRFVWLWSGQTISSLGDQFSHLAIPVLAVTVLGASASDMGVLNAFGTASFLLVGLIAGAWVDRLAKKQVMLVADLVRFLALLTIPLLWTSHSLQMWHIFVVVGVVGLASVFFDVAAQSFIPVLLPKDNIGAANGAMETARQVTAVGGPSLVGFLLGFLRAPLLILVDSISFLVSAISLGFLRHQEAMPDKAERQPLVREIAEGLKFVRGQKLIRTIALTTATNNLFGTMIFALMPLYILRTLGITTSQFGIMMSVGAVGGLLGAVLCNRLAKYFGEGPLIVGSAIVAGLAMLLMVSTSLAPQPAQLPLLITSQFLESFVVLTYNITQVTARQRLCPPRLLGRMNATIRFFIWGVMPISSLVAGWIGNVYGVTTAMWIGAIGVLVSSAWVVFSPIRTMRELPSHAE